MAFGRTKRFFSGRIASAVAIASAIATATMMLPVPAGAQFFGDRYPGYSGGDYYRQQPPRSYFPFPFFRGSPFSNGPFMRPPAPAESTKAPPPRKLDTTPTTTIAVIGDSLADWLAYGLEEGYADQPDIGIVRNVRPFSGLVRYDPHNDTLDWAQAVKDLLATEKPTAIVVMLGLNDRLPLRDGAAPHGAATPPAPPQNNAAAPAEPADEQPAGSDAPQPLVPGEAYDFRTDQWEQLYTKRVDEMITALKSRGVPVLWVGLPAIRGTRSTSDMSYLDDLYRARAERAGIIYVDIWDGFTDDSGRYAVEGPDFEGQIRRLRTSDGVHFTKAGAVKLASYVEHELNHALASHVAPVVLPGPEEAPKPGSNGQRPAVGPVLPLTSDAGGGNASATAAGNDGTSLVGAGNTTAAAPAALDPLAARVLTQGDPVAALPGRADDFHWPRPGADAGGAAVAAPVPVAAPSAAAPAKAVPGRNDGKKPGDARNDSKTDARNDSKTDGRNDSKAKPAAEGRRAPSAALDGAAH